jgi:RHS Repeat
VYDGADKVASETLVADAGRTYTVGFGYNGNEALSSVTYPAGHVVSYNPDGYGRPAAAAPYVTDVDYHPNGMPQQITYANGVTTGMGLNDRLWPASLNVNRTGGNIVQNAYGYDPAGNLTSITDSLDSAYNRTYGYDFVNRLTREAGSSGTFRYVYDNVGNITAVNEELLVNGTTQLFSYKSYVYDGSSASPTGTGRLLSFSSPTSFRFYSYDLSGNVRDDDAGTTFGYDRANNMRCSNCGGATQVLHAYDGANMRVKSTEGGVAAYSVYDHRGLLLQTEKPGVERKEYVYLGRRQVAERKIPLN